MTGIDIAFGDGYTLTSYGNGWAYTLRNGWGESLWWQDDDATALRDKWDAMERAEPNEQTGRLLDKLWYEVQP